MPPRPFLRLPPRRLRTRTGQVRMRRIPGAGAEEKSDEAGENSADTATENPFSGKTVKVGCSATFVPFESIEMAADGSKTYVGMNIDIVKAVVEKNGGQVEFVDMPFKS